LAFPNPYGGGFVRRRKSKKQKTLVLQTNVKSTDAPLHLKVQAPGRGEKPHNIGELHDERHIFFHETPHVGLITDVDEWLSSTTTTEAAHLRIPIDEYRKITSDLMARQDEKSSVFKKIYNKLFGGSSGIKRNPSKKDAENERMMEAHNREIAQLLDKIDRLENLARGNAADHLLSGVHPGFHIPTNRRNIVRLPTGPDFCSIYYDDDSERIVIDLIEGNFASDPGDISFTDLQRKMKKCLEDKGRIVVRWLNYVETPFHSYGHGVWEIHEFGL
jgi:hypothetical protein